MGLDFCFSSRAYLLCPVPRAQLRGQMALAVGITSSFSGGRCALGAFSQVRWQDSCLCWNFGWKQGVHCSL